MTKINIEDHESIKTVIQDLIDGYKTTKSDYRNFINKDVVKKSLIAFEKEYWEAMDNYEEKKILPVSYNNFLKKIGNENIKLEEEYKLAKKALDELFRRYDRERFSPHLDSIVGCAICDAPRGNSLDHYLPRSKFYHFTLTPINLIPMCNTCNTNKGEFSVNNKAKAPFHPYFEDFDFKKYVEVEINLNEEIHLNIKIIEKKEELYRRYLDNYKLFKLNKQYNVMAERTLNTLIESLIKHGIALDEESIKREIESKYEKIRDDVFLYFDDRFVEYLTLKKFFEWGDQELFKEISKRAKDRRHGRELAIMEAVI